MGIIGPGVAPPGPWIKPDPESVEANVGIESFSCRAEGNLIRFHGFVKAQALLAANYHFCNFTITATAETIELWVPSSGNQLEQIIFEVQATKIRIFGRTSVSNGTQIDFNNVVLIAK